MWFKCDLNNKMWIYKYDIDNTKLMQKQKKKLGNEYISVMNPVCKNKEAFFASNKNIKID